MDAIAVTHDTQKHRFEAWVEGYQCVADYHLDGRTLHLTHTVVPGPMEGRGIAAALVAAALQWAREQGLRVNPVCSYVRTYMQRHPETQDLLR